MLWHGVSLEKRRGELDQEFMPFPVKICYVGADKFLVVPDDAINFRSHNLREETLWIKKKYEDTTSDKESNWQMMLMMIDDIKNFAVIRKTNRNHRSIWDNWSCLKSSCEKAFNLSYADYRFPDYQKEVFTLCPFEFLWFAIIFMAAQDTNAVDEKLKLCTTGTQELLTLFASVINYAPCFNTFTFNLHSAREQFLSPTMFVFCSINSQFLCSGLLKTKMCRDKIQLQKDESYDLWRIMSFVYFKLKHHFVAFAI